MSDMPTASPPPVNRKQLEQLAAEKGVDYGQMTCFDGQTVHIISGRFRNTITTIMLVLMTVMIVRDILVRRWASPPPSPDVTRRLP